MLDTNQGGGSPPPVVSSSQPIAIHDGDGDPYFDVLEFIEPLYRDVGVKRFRIDGLSYSWKSVPEGRHLRIMTIAADRVWMTSPQMFNSAGRLIEWLREHPDVYVEATAPGMLRSLLVGYFHPRPLVDGLYKEVGGFLWPAHDKLAAPLILAEAENQTLDRALSGVKDFRVAVQAGGNVGVFPVRLSERFKMVYTFEPVDELRECLARNLISYNRNNVMVGKVALGRNFGTASMTSTEGNVGAGQITDGKDFGVVPLDSFKLDGVGLIWLDVNGTEALVLEGGFETIERCRPVIIVEDGELSLRHGLERYAATKWLLGRSYRRVGTTGPDTIFHPSERYE